MALGVRTFGEGVPRHSAGANYNDLDGRNGPSEKKYPGPSMVFLVCLWAAWSCAGAPE